MPTPSLGHVDGAQSLIERHGWIPAQHLELQPEAATVPTECLHPVDHLLANASLSIGRPDVQVFHVQSPRAFDGEGLKVAESVADRSGAENGQTEPSGEIEGDFRLVRL